MQKKETGKKKVLAIRGIYDTISAVEVRFMGMDVEIDKFTPCLEDAKTGELVETEYSLAMPEELKGLCGWAFNWNAKNLQNAQIYKLTTKNNKTIQGLIAVTPHPQDRAMYVNIAEAAPHNRGSSRQYMV